MLSTTKVMLTGKIGERHKIPVPHGGELLRAGIDPATGQPAVWYLADPEELDGSFIPVVVVTTGMAVPDGAQHIGMWWGGVETFHLFKLEESDHQE